MQIEQVVEQLASQLDLRPSLGGKAVVLRVAGKDYALRRIAGSASSIIIEGGEELTHDDSLSGPPSTVPGGPEGEGVEPAPPAEVQAEMDERQHR